MPNTRKVAELPDVLETTQEVQAQLEAESRDLFVVNEVLKQEIPVEIKSTGDVAAALERSEIIQTNLGAVVENLEDVNQVLAEEVARRKSAEKKLTETRADLADTKAQLADAKDHQ